MRAFAFAVLFALALIPKTAWVVRSHAEMLRGGYKSLGAEMGMRSAAVFPNWPFESGVEQSPSMRVLRDDEGPDAYERLVRAEAAFRDPKLREQLSPIVLRRGFTSIVVSNLGHPEADLKMGRIAHKLLPLAQAGEKAEPDNAYFPSCAWALYTALKQPTEARAALARAARCDRYDDAVTAEARYLRDEVEKQFGYQGSLLRIHLHGQILLPQYAALGRLATKVAQSTSLADPQRRDIVALGEVMMRAGTERITMMVGKNLALKAMGNGELPKGKIEDALPALTSSFGKANPDLDMVALTKLIRGSDFQFEETVADYEGALDAPYRIYGAGLLVALACALGLSLPNLGGEAATLKARLSRASWAWLALPLGMVFEDRQGPNFYSVLLVALAGYFGLMRKDWGLRPAVVLGGLICLGTTIAAIPPANSPPTWLIAPVLWVAAFAVPFKYNGIARVAVVALVAYATVNRFIHPVPGWMMAVGLGLAVLAIRGTLPQKKDLAWLPAVLALAYLGIVAAELTRDAQLAEVNHRLGEEATRFRAERGIG